MSFSISNKNWIVLSTALLIGVVFSVYFLVYVKGNEKDIISNNFRVLQKVVQNIKSLEKSYKKNAEIRSLLEADAVEYNDDIKPLFDPAKCEKLNTLVTSNTRNGIFYGNEGLYFSVDKIINPKDTGACLYYFTDYNLFFSNGLFQRKDVFDRIIISKFQRNNTASPTDRTVIYSNAPIGIMDSVFNYQLARSAIDEITINNKKYISFNQEINEEENIMISGLILKSSFDQQKRSVSPYIIFSLSVALVLIILAMPILKLKIMSLEERLHIKDVVFGVISVLIGPAIFIIFLSATFILADIEKQHVNDNLKALSRKAENNFQNELTRIVDQLHALNAQFSSLKNHAIVTDTSFGLDNESKILFDSIFGPSIVGDNSWYDISGYKVYHDIIDKDIITYKHLKAAFWCTETAKIMVIMSVFNNPGYAQNLGHRKYITNIINNKPFFFKDKFRDNEVHQVAIESIKSVSDGSYEIGVGMATQGIKLPVIAISAKLSSIMGSITEEGYGFCIVDKNGNTIFHSDIMKNMNENFLDETNQIFLSSIKSHIGTYKTANYSGKDQTIYFRPLDCLSDHYIATFVKNEAFYNPITVSMISAFVMFVCYLSILLIVYLLLYFSNFKDTKLKQITYIFNFIRPYETSTFFTKYKHFTLISWVIMIYILLSVWLNSQHYDFIISELIIVSTIMLTCVFYSFTYELHKEKILHTGFRKPSIIIYSIVVAVIFLILVIRFFTLVSRGPGFLLIANMILGLCVVLYIVLEVLFDKNIFRIKFVDRIERDLTQIQKVYRNFLVIWVIILSIIPITIFIKITYEKENEIVAKIKSLELFEDLKNWEAQNEREFGDKFNSEDSYAKFVNSMKLDSMNFNVIEPVFKYEKLISSSYAQDEYKVAPDRSSIFVRKKDSVYVNQNQIEVVEDIIYVVDRPNIYDHGTEVKRRGKIYAIRVKDSIEVDTSQVVFNKNGTVEVIRNTNIIHDIKSAKISSEIENVRYYSRENFDKIYAKIRPEYNERSKLAKGFVDNISSDNSWVFNSGNTYNETTLNPLFNSNMEYTKILFEERGFFTHNLGMILIVIVISIIILFNFLDFILSKIYGFHFRAYADYVNQIRKEPISGLFLKDQFFTNDSSYNNIFLVGVNSAHTPIVRNIFKKMSNKKLLTLDFYDFNEKLDEGSKTSGIHEYKLKRFDRDWGKIRDHYEKSDEQIFVLVEHFEFGYNDLKLNKLKLDILTYLVDDPNFKVIVKSEINATKLLDFYEGMINELERLIRKQSVDEHLELQEKLNDLKVDYKKWQHLLGSFIKYIVPIKVFNEADEAINTKNTLEQYDYEHHEEIKHGEFLDMLRGYISQSRIKELPYEDKIMTIQQMSYPYYFAIWNSLSKEERYLVYDIAKDKFVNTVNTNAIFSLLVKGILIYDHSLRLMNDSFTNFVLTKVKSDEALEMEMESRKKGSWNTAFSVILLLVVSIVIFLSIGQQNFLNDLNSFLTAIAALVGLLIRFSGFLTFGGNKTAGA